MRFADNSAIIFWQVANFEFFAGLIGIETLQRSRGTWMQLRYLYAFLHQLLKNPADFKDVIKD